MVVSNYCPSRQCNGEMMHRKVDESYEIAEGRTAAEELAERLTKQNGPCQF